MRGMRTPTVKRLLGSLKILAEDVEARFGFIYLLEQEGWMHEHEHGRQLVREGY